MEYPAKDLFHLQAELVDAKVDIAVNKAIDKVIEQIAGLKTDIHELRDEMNMRFSAVDKRLVAVETRLGMVSKKEEAFSSRLLDYAFKAMWVILGTAATAALFLLAHH